MFLPRPPRCPNGRPDVCIVPMLARRVRQATQASPFPCKTGIVCRAGKSIMQMLLREHRMTVGGLRLCSCLCYLCRSIEMKSVTVRGVVGRR